LLQFLQQRTHYLGLPLLRRLYRSVHYPQAFFLAFGFAFVFVLTMGLTSSWPKISIPARKDSPRNMRQLINTEGLKVSETALNVVAMRVHSRLFTAKRFLAADRATSPSEPSA
jgi:hypothetical protein